LKSARADCSSISRSLIQAGGGHRLPDHRPQDLHLGRIFGLGGGVIAHQSLDLGQVVIQVGIGEGRGEMIDDAAIGAALGLGALTGIIDDVWVDVGQLHDRQIRITLVGKTKRLAGQPFQRAVFAHMHHCVGLEDVADPAVLGQIMMRRRQVEIVQHLVDLLQIPTRGLDAQKNIAVDETGKVECVLVDKEFTRHLAPIGSHFVTDRRGEFRMPVLVLIRPGPGFGPSSHLVHGQPALVAGHLFQEGMGQFILFAIIMVNLVALFPHSGQQGRDTGKGVETGGATDAVVAGRVMMKDDGDPSLGRGNAAEPGPVECQTDHFIDPFRDG
jgi:hypothetical protein